VPRRRILTAQQSANLSVLAAINVESKTASLRVERRIREELEQELREYTRRKCELAYQLHISGVSQRALQDALGTTDWRTVKDLIAQGTPHTIEVGHLPDTVPPASALEVDTDAPAGAKLSRISDEALGISLDLDDPQHAALLAATGADKHDQSLWSATFDVETLGDGRVFFDPSPDNPLFIADQGINHPVTAWLLQYPDNEKAVRAWWTSRN